MENVRAKKILGQHFLTDIHIAESICNLLDRNTKKVVEIGPGMGVLTQFLIKKYQTKLIEIDKESIIYLRKKWSDLNIIEGDFLVQDLNQIMKSKFSLIGNFPYNISNQILFKTFENKQKINELVGMFQKEVAERIVCKRGKKRGILSVLIQTYYNTEYCMTVPACVFHPKPKVESAVIKLVRNDRKELFVDENKYLKIIKSAFNQKRKTIKNALKKIFILDCSSIKDLLNLRAEELSVEDFIKLTKHAKQY